MTAPPPARTLDFGASATASLLVKMTITYGMSERRDQMITYSLFEKLMRNEMPQDQGDLDAILLIEDKRENLINNLASSWIYEKLVTNVRLSDKITDTKIEYSHLYSTSSLLPHWDTIHATGSTLIASPLRSQQPARFSAASSSSSSNVLVTNYKPPRLTDKQSDTQVYLTLVALEHASASLDFGQMTSITSEHTDLSVHWNSTVLRSQLTRTPEIDTILQFLASIKTLYDPSHKHPSIERQLRKIKHKPGELPRDYLIRFQKKLIELEDAAVISGTQSNYHIISSVAEQVKQSTKGMNSEFKQQLKVQMHARQVVGFGSWAQYLKFVTSVQRAVHSDTDASSDDGNKDVISRRRFGPSPSQPASERHPRIYFQTASSPKTVSGQRTRVTVCLTSTMYSAPMETNVSAIMPTTPNRRLRQLQRTARTHRHRKCERSTHRCASWLRRRSDCSWRRRSPASSAAAVKRMIRTRYRRIVSSIELTQLGLKELNATLLGSAQLGSTQLNSS